MKKTYIALMAALAAPLFFAACDEDCSDMAAPETTIKVSKAQTSLEATNGEGFVTIDAPIATAYTNHSEWLSLSVSGQTVSLSASDNDDPQSRNAILVVKKTESDSIVVNISQLGLIFVVENDDIILSSDDAAEVSFSVSSTRDVTIADAPDWAEAVVEGGKVKVSVSENTTGSRRIGYVTVAAGAYTEKVLISQFEFAKDVVGSYTLEYYDIDLEDYTSTSANITTDGLYVAEIGLTLPVKFDASSFALKLTSGSQIGTYGGKTAFLVFTDASYNVSISGAASGSVTAPLVTDSEGKTTATFAGTAYTSGSKSVAFSAFAIATSTSGALDRSVQFPVIMQSPKLVRK